MSGSALFSQRQFFVLSGLLSSGFFTPTIWTIQFQPVRISFFFFEDKVQRWSRCSQKKIEKKRESVSVSSWRSFTVFLHCHNSDSFTSQTNHVFQCGVSSVRECRKRRDERQQNRNPDPPSLAVQAVFVFETPVHPSPARRNLILVQFSQ